MKMTWHSSACVSYTSKGTRILFDPWLVNSAYLGSWQQWPPAESALNHVLETKFDFIVYTHFHSDHWDAGFLREYLKIWKLRKHKPKIIVSQNSWPQLERAIKNVGKDDISLISLPSNRKFSLNEFGFNITMFESDFCDPILCGKSLPCYSPESRFRAFDSASILQDDDITILNLNDAVSSQIDLHLMRMGITADVVMGVFSAAGSFPQCIDSYSQREKLLQREKFIDNALDRLLMSAERMNAKYIFPFAGQYILSGRLASLNDYRAVLPASQACEELKQRTERKVFTLGTNESVVFAHRAIESLGEGYSEPSDDIKSIYLNQKNNSYFYESRSIEAVDLDTLVRNLENSSVKLKSMYEKVQKTRYFIRLQSQFDEIKWNLEFGENLSFGPEIQQSDSDYCLIRLDLRLLDSCLRRRSGHANFTSVHWNQAHIGSHLSFKQSRYDSQAHYLLNFLHN